MPFLIATVAQCDRPSAPFGWLAHLAMPVGTCPVDHAVADLADVAHLVDCQCGAGLSRDDVLDALFRSWSSRLSLLSTCSDAQKSSLTAAITSGPWSCEQRKALARVLIFTLMHHQLQNAGRIKSVVSLKTSFLHHCG